MAIVLPKISGRRVSSRRSIAGRTEPALGIRLLTLQSALEPHETLDFEYRVQRVDPENVDRLEVSVVWFTEGKGSEDIGVHSFESLTGEELQSHCNGEPRRAETTLPGSPLSYSGRLFQVRWCVRLRLFLADGREIATEQPIYLGHLSNQI